jgi:hypothetical protein
VERGGSTSRDANPVASRRVSSRDGRVSMEHTWLRSSDLLQNPNYSSRVNLNRILNLKTRTTYEPGVVVLTRLQGVAIIADYDPSVQHSDSPNIACIHSKDFGVGWIRVITTPSQTATSVGPATCVIRLSSSGGPLDSSLEGILPHPPADFNLLWHLSFIRGAYREVSFQFLSLSFS